MAKRDTQLNVMVSKVMATRIRKQAEENGVTLKDHVKSLLDKGMKHKGSTGYFAYAYSEDNWPYQHERQKVKDAERKIANLIVSQDDWKRRYCRQKDRCTELADTVAELKGRLANADKQAMYKRLFGKFYRLIDTQK